MGCTRCLSRVRRPHWKAPPAKLHHAAAHADREDDPAPGIRSPQKELALWPAIRRHHQAPGGHLGRLAGLPFSFTRVSAGAGSRSPRRPACLAAHAVPEGGGAAAVARRGAGGSAHAVAECRHAAAVGLGAAGLTAHQVAECGCFGQGRRRGRQNDGTGQGGAGSLPASRSLRMRVTSPKTVQSSSPCGIG